MTTVRATCDDCGDVEIHIDVVWVAICREDVEGRYGFTCSGCGLEKVKDCQNRRLLELLVGGGADLFTWWRPVDSLRVGFPSGGLTVDDAIDFHVMLADDRAVGEAVMALAEAT